MLQVKVKHLFEEIGRGVILPNCKLCGAIVWNRELHVKWHNGLGK